MILFGFYIVVLLVVCSVYDWKYCGLPMWLVIIGGIGSAVGVLGTVLWRERSVSEVIYALLPGIFTILLAYASREQIGYGDGLILLMLGGYAGVGDTIKILMLALAGSFVVSIVLLLGRKATGNSRIPFVPFLTLGSVLVMVGGWVSG